MPAAGIPAPLLRRGLLGLAAVLVAVVAIAVATTEPAGGQAPLECDGGLYVTTGSPDDMTLTRVDQETGALTAVGDGGLVANALGHNPQDDFLYGIDRNAPHHVVRVSAGGDEVDLGPAVGAPASWVLTFVGTFLANGHYLVLGDNAPARASRGTVPGTWAEIDVTAGAPEVIRTFSHPSIGNNDLQDIALNPVDGELYGHSITRHRIVRINPTTGAATGIGPTFARPGNAGSVVLRQLRADVALRVGPVRRRPGHALPHRPRRPGQARRSSPRAPPSPTPTAPPARSPSAWRRRSTGPPPARAPRSPTATRSPTRPSTPTPRRVPRPSRPTSWTSSPTTVAPSWPASLVNPLGGDVAAYGGTDRLRIDDLAIPHDSTATIQVAVALPADMAAGTVMNQARLVDLTGNLGTQVLSEFPGTPRAARRHAARRPELRRHQRGQDGRRRGGRTR